MINFAIAAPGNEVAPLAKRGGGFSSSCNALYLDSDGWTLEASRQIKKGSYRVHTKPRSVPACIVSLFPSLTSHLVLPSLFLIIRRADADLSLQKILLLSAAP